MMNNSAAANPRSSTLALPLAPEVVTLTFEELVGTEVDRTEGEALTSADEAAAMMIVPVRKAVRVGPK